MGVARLYTVGSPYNGVELEELAYEQTADVCYLAHIDHPVRKLSRLAHTSWTFSEVTFGPGINAPGSVSVSATNVNDGVPGTGSNNWPITQEYVVCAVSAATGQTSRASGSASTSNDLTLAGNFNTVTWAAVTGAERYLVYKSEEGSGVYGYIGSATGTTFKDNNISADFTDSPPLARNPFSGEGDYPSTVTFFDQRLMLGRTKNKPNGVWGSQSANFENMDVSRPVKADDALSFALVAAGANPVNHLVSSTSLLALTANALFAIRGGGDSPLSPTNILPRRQVGRGSSRLRPLVVDEVVFYRPPVGSSVRTAGFAFDIDGYKSDDVSIFSPHLFAGFDILWWAYGQEPLSVIWAGRSDGKLLCFTWESAQQVWGWTLCETDGFPLSGAIISEGGEDRLYLVVRRTIDGVEKRFIERMAPVLWADQKDACYLDCARSFAFETAQTVIGTLWHLEGAEVVALADGNVVRGLTVSAGRVTLPFAALKVTVGLPFTSLIETLPPPALATGGRQSNESAKLRVLETGGVEIGANEASLFPVKERTTEPLGEPTDLTTGILDVDLAPIWSEEATVVVRSADPRPMTVLGVYYKGRRND